MDTTRPIETCEVCGGEVSDETARRADLSIGDAMCPTPMTFHEDCFEQAADLWKPPSEDSTCVVDPAYPETAQWTSYERLES